MVTLREDSLWACLFADFAKPRIIIERAKTVKYQGINYSEYQDELVVGQNLSHKNSCFQQAVIDLPPRFHLTPNEPGTIYPLAVERLILSLLDESYDEKFDDIFKLEDSLCVKVLNSLLVTLDHEETQGLQRRYTENQQAYETFLKAHFFMNKLTPDGIDKSISHFRQAIDLDPKYAMAYAGLSDSYMRLSLAGKAPAEFLPKSRAAVMKALELDETVAYAHSMLGRIAFQDDWDFPRAERKYARALELNQSWCIPGTRLSC